MYGYHSGAMHDACVVRKKNLTSCFFKSDNWLQTELCKHHNRTIANFKIYQCILFALQVCNEPVWCSETFILGLWTCVMSCTFMLVCCQQHRHHRGRYLRGRGDRSEPADAVTQPTKNNVTMMSFEPFTWITTIPSTSIPHNTWNWGGLDCS